MQNDVTHIPKLGEPRFSVPEFAAILGVGLTKAWELINTRQVASIKLGKKVYVPEPAINDYLARCYRPVFDARSEAAAMLGSKPSSIQKTARRKAAQS
jgi:hypothetical protein